MDEAKRKRLDAKGYVSVEVEDLLELNEEERKTVDLRVRLARAVKAIRVARGMTQAQLGKAIGSTQAKAALAEMGSLRVSLDLMFRAYFELGGSLEGLASGNVMPEGVAASRESPSTVSRVRPKPAKAKGKAAASKGTAPAKKGAGRKVGP